MLFKTRLDRSILKEKGRTCLSGRQGYITLTIVLICLAVLTTIGSSGLLSGLARARSAGVVGDSAGALGAASACAEEALELLQLSPSFTGSGSLTLGRATCSYSVARTALRGRILVRATGTAAVSVRKLEIIIERIRPKIVISSWRDVQ